MHSRTNSCRAHVGVAMVRGTSVQIDRAKSLSWKAHDVLQKEEWQTCIGEYFEFNYEFSIYMKQKQMKIWKAKIWILLFYFNFSAIWHPSVSKLHCIARGQPLHMQRASVGIQRCVKSRLVNVCKSFCPCAKSLFGEILSDAKNQHDFFCTFFFYKIFVNLASILFIYRLFVRVYLYMNLLIVPLSCLVDNDFCRSRWKKILRILLKNFTWIFLHLDKLTVDPCKYNFKLITVFLKSWRSVISNLQIGSFFQHLWVLIKYRFIDQN